MPERKLYLGPLTDNRRWDHIALRAGDVVVTTPPKSGTTWMQTITALLLSGDPEVRPQLAANMPWIDLRVRDIHAIARRVNGWTHRRSLKSHTPMDGLPYHPDVQYLCVFRHPLDTHFSMRKHVKNMPMNPTGFFFPDGDDDMTFTRFLDGGPEGHDGDAVPLAHIMRHFKAARWLADRPNVTLFHYADMTRDLAGTFTKVAQRLDLQLAPKLMAELVAQASFENMKADSGRFAPTTSETDDAFFDSGTSGKWAGVLTQAQLTAYETAMRAHVSSDQERAWLEYGSE